MTGSNTTPELVLTLVKKIAHLQENVEQTRDEKSKVTLCAERDKFLNELKAACAKMPELVLVEAVEKSSAPINDEPGYPTV